MLSLNDLIHTATYSLEDTLRFLEAERDQRIELAKSYDESSGDRRTEEDGLLGQIGKLDSDTYECERREHDINDQISVLTSQLNEIRTELDRVKSERSQIDQRFIEMRRDGDDIRRKKNEIEKEIATKSNDVFRCKSRILQAKRGAYESFLEASWEKVLSLLGTSEAVASSRASYEALQSARSSDTSVATLWEAREEWIRILRSAIPQLVKETAQRELTSLEENLKTRFPGALEYEVDASSQSGQLLEFYWWSTKKGNRCIALPIPLRVYNRIGEGHLGDEEKAAMYLYWAFNPLCPSPDASVTCNAFQPYCCVEFPKIASNRLQDLWKQSLKLVCESTCS